MSSRGGWLAPHSICSDREGQTPRLGAVWGPLRPALSLLPQGGVGIPGVAPGPALPSSAAVTRGCPRSVAAASPRELPGLRGPSPPRHRAGGAGTGLAPTMAHTGTQPHRAEMTQRRKPRKVSPPQRRKRHRPPPQALAGSREGGDEPGPLGTARLLAQLAAAGTGRQRGRAWC